MIWRARVVDALLALLTAGVCVAEVLSGQVPAPLWAGVLVSVLFGASTAVWRRAPFTALVGCYTVMVLCVPLGVPLYQFLGSVIAGLLVVASVAAAYRLWPALAGVAVAYIVLLFTALTDPGGWLWGAFLLAATFGAGRVFRARAALIAELRRTSAELEATREQHLRAAVADERSRIARELHDVVAHSVSVMVVQAGAAQRMIPVDPQRATGALDSVQDVGRQALAELRRLLGVLRPGDTGSSLRPQPGLTRVDDVADPLRAAGLRVDVERSGDVRPLAAGVELAAYRILQEALTNVLRHAHAQRVCVRLRYGVDALDLEVTDDGTGGPSVVVGSGQGLVGMTERAELYDGHLHAAPAPGGGFTVRAHLPLAAPA